MLQRIHCFIICDGGFRFGRITAYQIVAPDVNSDSIQVLSVFLFQSDTVVYVHDLQVFSAEVTVIAVDKTIIPSFSCVGLDTVSGDNADLGTVIGYKIMLPRHIILWVA